MEVVTISREALDRLLADSKLLAHKMEVERRRNERYRLRKAAKAAQAEEAGA
ncbi:hypothetical protein RBB84_02500 [Rhodococcus sp. D-6]|uniref:Uncharacterized protein n=1 Tax=Rhodococcus sp. D-6 TaxID=1387842 RepID=A0AAU7UZL5_9NOCA|nr:hypothetical protein [Rhodococcus sp. HS-D2]